MPAVKHIVSGAVILLVIGAGTYFFMQSFDPSANAAACSEKHLKIAAFGDSLVAGYGATQGHDFPSLLSETLGVPVQNLGVSGNTTADALARIDKVIAAKPDVVIVLLGGNDALQKIPANITSQNLSYIITALQSKNIAVVLVGVPGGFPSDPYATMFQSIAKQFTPIAYVPNILSGLIGNSTYMSDQVHPNDAGYAKVAAKLVPAIESICGQK